MKIQIEIGELQTLQIDDLARRTGCKPETLFECLFDRLQHDANNISYLHTATDRTIHEHYQEQEQINKLKSTLYKNGNKRN